MKYAFGGLISVLLLGIYIHLVRLGINIVLCLSETECTEYTAEYFNAGMEQALSIIGGLVSALVIAELAIAKPGEALVKRAIPEAIPNLAKWSISAIAIFYVVCWIGAGFASFMVGLYHPKELPVLTNLGQAWLGLAVSAAYAYFGIKPSNG